VKHTGNGGSGHTSYDSAIDIKDNEQETTSNSYPNTSSGPKKDDKATGKQRSPSKEAMPSREMVVKRSKMTPASNPIMPDGIDSR
jgi:hypothetical protein